VGANRDENWDPDKAVWELYKLDDDFSQANDIAKDNPEKLRELQDLWWVEAAKYNVLPLDWRGTIRFNAELMGRPSLVGKRTTAVLPRRNGGPGRRRLPADAQQVLDHHRDIDLPDNAARMIITHGGSEGGYGLYLRDGKATFVTTFWAGSGQPSRARRRCPRAGPRSSLTSPMTAAAWARAEMSPLKPTARRSPKAAGADSADPVLDLRGPGRRHGLRLARRLHLQAAVAFTGKIDKVTIKLGPVDAKPPKAPTVTSTSSSGRAASSAAGEQTHAPATRGRGQQREGVIRCPTRHP